ncbi:pseudouridine synthase [Aureimonas populi]|uniref:Pseudouridine synthase n=1 Tax=Aureimonas populi TaxID=1701758 RepID=A0ABW5CIQ0_9HYPH|nr:pseudouridine synthase [Aureimonas populi]
MNDKTEGGKRGGGQGRPGGGFRKGGKPGGFKPRGASAQTRGEGPAREGRPFAKGGERPAGSRPFRPREDRPQREGEAERRFAPRGEGRGEERKPFRPREERGGEPAGERKPFRPREPRPEGERRGDKPFVPRSRGMVSHGGRDADGAAKPARSHGRLSHEGQGGERKPRSFSDRPREDRPRREERDERPRRAAPAEGGGVGTMRIAKRLARAGIASRRDAEGMIADGRVKLNGKILDTPAVEVSASDRIEVDGAPLPAIERTRLWLFHKPAGLVTTNRDPEGRPTVFDRLPEEMPRVLTVGRLDINTEGLLLLTNDGGLARTLELPATGWLRRYRVRAHGEVSQERLDELRQGIAIEGVFYGAIEASLDREQGSNVWLTLGLREGKNREVKRVLGHLGLEVNRLIRLSFGPFQLGELAEGAVQEIKGRTLRDQLGERLIEESGADFDAPIVNTFSNKPVQAETPPRTEKPAARSEWISASDGGRPNRKKFGEKKRDDALGRLDTRAPRAFDKGDRPERGPRPERGERPFGDRKPRSFGDKREGGGDADAKPARRPPSAPKRTANVWMAPGARAVGEKKQAEREARDRDRTEGRTSRGPRPAPRGGPRSDGDRPRGRPKG